MGGIIGAYAFENPLFFYLYTYNLNDSEELKRANAITEEWARVSLEITGRKTISGLYRSGSEEAKVLMPKFEEYYQLLKRLTRMMGPNRIMNPGKLIDMMFVLTYTR